MFRVQIGFEVGLENARAAQSMASLNKSSLSFLVTFVWNYTVNAGILYRRVIYVIMYIGNNILGHNLILFTTI